jgi:predicted glycosyltransferase
MPAGRGKALFDLVHPADALFFCHPIRALLAEGIEVRIASRHKDVLVPLLDELGLSHVPLGRAGEGKVGLGLELLRRDYRLWKFARAFRPQVMAGFGGVAIAHVGKLTGIPSLSFYDTEHAGLQIRLALPFISQWHVPETWRGPEAKGRTFRFKGGKQFAYLHPNHFLPDPVLAEAAGWDPGRDNFLVRTVAWRANHDHGRSGFSPERLRAIVATLAARGKVHISAEGELPQDLEPLRYRGTATGFHHLLAHCRLYCGESITVASEAVMLGIPALLQIDKDYGYIAEQEEAGLIRRLDASADVGQALDEALAEDRQAYRERSRAFVAARGDVNHYVVEAIRNVLKEGAAG